MKPIIITGVSGFVGRNFAQYLASNDSQYIGVSLRNSQFALDNNARAVIHLAGKAHDTENTTEESQYFAVNTELTKKLFDDFLASEIRDFVFFSSVKAVADTLDSQVLDEIHSPDPRTPYGKSKWEAEKYLLSQPLPYGKRLFIIRPCMIHGVGNKGNLNLLYKVVQKGVPWFLASFENRRSFLSIDNLNYMLWHLLQNENIPSGVYNFADDEAVSTNELIAMIAETLGRKPRLWHLSKRYIEGVARLGDFLKLPLNTERLKKLTESYIVSNEKIKNALGIAQLPLSARDGLIKTLKTFQND